MVRYSGSIPGRLLNTASKGQRVLQ